MGALNGKDQADVLLARARAGDPAALGRLLELYRNYLRVLASAQLGADLRLRLDPSDLVQETFLEAYRDFRRFQGTSERELVAWLRQILVRNLADQAKHHRAKGRDPRREESLEAMLERSSIQVHQALARGISSPSVQAARREKAVVLADALARLSDDYREVIVLRNLQHLKFDEIAVRMGRSSSAVRTLWARALVKLRHVLGGPA
ncbi:MAG: sigma-70 family RNA polymerase sigma factor [Planctomycetes bacterium]|nr:sigma-70 family RNA polymerase sigma factor [Planctomycetota bacterium]